MAKRRLDTLLVDRGLAPDRAKAQALVMAGQVSVDEHPAPKAGMLVPEEASLRLAERPRFVSRGGDKLDQALETFGLDVRCAVVADIGASTGGFTDCLLQRGAERVYAIDVGKGQLDYRLRNDARVVVMEGVNARDMTALPEAVDFVTMDVSFISLRLVLPAIRGIIAAARPFGSAQDRPTSTSGRADPGVSSRPALGAIVALLKPQFEAKKSEVPRGGVITDPQLHATIIGRFAAWCVGNGFHIVDLTSSPILGADGNREFFFWLRPEPSPPRPPSRARARGRNGVRVGESTRQ
jgi:23S rRNA (cytidine1920-2'-O)/16S rRNA (cytidine1409-2'-O)-methyltransferase